MVEVDQRDTVNISITPPPAGRNITKWRFYRSNVGTVNAAFQFLDEGPITTTTGTDGALASQLGEVLPTSTWAEPPAGLRGICEMHSGIIAGFFDNTTAFCEPFTPYAWPVEYQLSCNQPIVAQESFGQTLVRMHRGGVDYISKPFFIDEILERIRIHLMLSQGKPPLITEDNDTHPSHGADIPLNPLPANLMLKQVATEFIMNHINDPAFKSADVASSLKISLRRLNAIFEACDGLSAFEFIRQERMRRAALMLGQSTLAVADVALEVGYANSANFSTEFRKFWGKSPTQLRSESQMDPSTLQQLISSKFN